MISIRFQFFTLKLKEAKILDFKSALFNATIALCNTYTKHNLIVCTVGFEMANYTVSLTFIFKYMLDIKYF